MFCNEDRIIEGFYQKYDVMKVPFEKEIVIDIASRKKELRPKDDISSYNSNVDGALVFPDPANGHFYILINEKICRSKCDYFDTLIHEITHLSDYINFAELYCNSKHLEIVKHPSWWEFYHYSEFHAKKLGLIYYYQTQIDEGTINLDFATRNNILNRFNDVFEQSQQTIRVISETKNISYEQGYDLFRSVGKLSAWAEVFPTVLNTNIYFKAYDAVNMGFFFDLYNELNAFSLGNKNSINILKICVEGFIKHLTLLESAF